MRDYRELKVWQKSHRLTIAIYSVSRDFPREELYGLTSQVRRSCASIPANIAEGCGRFDNAELSRFLQIALGSACELDYHLFLARDLGYLSKEAQAHLESELKEVRRMLVGMMQKLAPTS